MIVNTNLRASFGVANGANGGVCNSALERATRSSKIFYLVQRRRFELNGARPFDSVVLARCLGAFNGGVKPEKDSTANRDALAEAASALVVAIIVQYFLTSIGVFLRRGLLCSGLAAPVLAEVLYDRGGRAAPLLIFGPIMILTAIFAGEQSRQTLSVYGVSAICKESRC